MHSLLGAAPQLLVAPQEENQEFFSCCRHAAAPALPLLPLLAQFLLAAGANLPAAPAAAAVNSASPCPLLDTCKLLALLLLIATNAPLGFCSFHMVLNAPANWLLDVTNPPTRAAPGCQSCPWADACCAAAGFQVRDVACVLFVTRRGPRAANMLHETKSI